MCFSLGFWQSSTSLDSRVHWCQQHWRIGFQISVSSCLFSMEDVLKLGRVSHPWFSKGSMACNQAFSIIWCYGLVRTFSNDLCQLVLRKLLIRSRFIVLFGLIYIIISLHIRLDSIWINKSIRTTMERRKRKRE